MPEKKWIKVLDTKSVQGRIVPGNPVRVIAGSRKICLVGNGSEFFAVGDRCPHQGASLSEGFLEQEDIIVCPLHRFRFSLRSGRHQDPDPCGGIEVFPVELRSDGLYLQVTLGWQNMFD